MKKQQEGQSMYQNTPLFMQAGVPTRQTSAENPTGEKNAGCRAIPNPDDPDLRFSGAALRLGEGWKVRPFIPLSRGQTAVLADIEGPGCINQIFLTSDIIVYSGLVLRIYWDGEETPSVECPMGAFFAMGHDYEAHTVYSSMVTVAPVKGMNCYWQMPFRKHARVTLSNEGSLDARVVAYRVLYKLHDIPEEAAYFHAQYRRSLTTRELPEHTLLEGVKGKGVYVGTYLACNVLTSAWWGEGEVKFYLDGDEYPSIADNGTEDYFGGAWCFGAKHAFTENGYILAGAEEAFCSPYLGLPLAKSENPYGPRKYGMYRWHILDSIGFEEDIKVTIQTLAWYLDRTFRPAPTDIASVSYWYQAEPHNTFPELPSWEERCDL